MMVVMMMMTMMMMIMILSAESLNQMRIFLEFYNDHEKTGIISNIPNQVKLLKKGLFTNFIMNYYSFTIETL